MKCKQCGNDVATWKHLLYVTLMCMAMVAALVYYGQMMKECVIKVNTKIRECNDYCMCPWEDEYTQMLGKVVNFNLENFDFESWGQG